MKYHNIEIFIDGEYKEERLPYKKKYFIACDSDNHVYIHYDKPVYTNGYHISIKGKYLVGKVLKCDDYTKVFTNNLHEKLIGFKSISCESDSVHVSEIELNTQYHRDGIIITITDIEYHPHKLYVNVHRTNCTIGILKLPVKRLIEDGMLFFREPKHWQMHLDYKNLMKSI